MTVQEVMQERLFEKVRFILPYTGPDGVFVEGGYSIFRYGKWIDGREQDDVQRTCRNMGIRASVFKDFVLHRHSYTVVFKPFEGQSRPGILNYSWLADFPDLDSAVRYTEASATAGRVYGPRWYVRESPNGSWRAESEAEVLALMVRAGLPDATDALFVLRNRPYYARSIDRVVNFWRLERVLDAA